MQNETLLLEVTESYLESLIAEVCNSPGARYDSLAPFRELSIDSFHVLKIIKRLEGDFGALPKTLLFERFNIQDLAGYFVERHRSVLVEKFAVPERSEPTAGEPVPAAPVLILEERAWAEPALREVLADLFEKYRSEGSISRGTRTIAPNLFIGSERRGYLNYSRCHRIILVYAYTGPEEYFPTIAREMLQYCSRHEFQLNILSDRAIGSIGEAAFSATPFGALQRVRHLKDFALDGGAMRRLRYQVSRFEKSGVCRTVEYHCGTDSATDRDIVRVIEEWCAPKAMVNPLVEVVKAEILAGALHARHRLFLTYVDDVLHNVILISGMSASLGGYLMDLEFYTQSMPLGGLEFAIVRIIATLVAEGCDLLSLGGTYGCKLESSPHADPEVDRILDELRQQGIFNDQGNLQFKNKFRPENRPIYLCRPVGSGKADNVLDIIMMIADPAKMQTSDQEHHNNVSIETAAPEPAHTVIEGLSRSTALALAGFNPLRVPVTQIDIDFKTDSWAQLKMPAIDARMSHLRSQLPQPIDVVESLKGVFPFTHFLLTASGRSAEHLLYRAWPTKGSVLQNLLFPTGIFYQIDNGFTPSECPDAEVFRLSSQEIFKGNLAWGTLRERVAENPQGIAFTCIEVGNNAAGGYPVSMQHLKSVKALLAEHSIPLVIDATRVVENARFLIERDPECARGDLWSVVREILACADVVTASLPKDFCVDHGGLIATHDTKLFRKLESLAQEEGSGLDHIDRKLIALSLKNLPYIEAQVGRRMEAVKDIWSALEAHGIPVVKPAGGHCVVIDVKQIEVLREFEHPVASFLAWLYLNTGIRAGAHSVGMQKRTSLDELVRLAIPVGMRREQVEASIQALIRLFEEKANIPELVMDGDAPESFGELSARYRLKKYHNPSGRIVAITGEPIAVLPSIPPTKVATTPTIVVPAPAVAVEREAAVSRTQDSRMCRDIAIVGMAGRYPKANNMEELWDNLANGRDCIEEMPVNRYEERLRHRSTARYRGGFIDNIGRFDSLFFNISPREAQMLDPQERLFLEVAWEALEDAGYYPESLAGANEPRNIGVFVGAVWTMYQMLGVEEKRLGNPVTPNSFLWSIANRVSYWMNLCGPSLTLDTACSSSLTALYLACEAIQAGDCSAALVGGVNLDLHQSKFDINFAGGALSKDGLCRSFGRGANGYVAGEGVGALFLKPLEAAIRQGDNIHGVIKGIVVNHGGRTSGYTVPNPKAQTALVLAALEKAGVDARSVGYIEAHGTGTELGDPIEIAALNSAFKSHHVEEGACAIGSVKSNLGHLEAAAGVVSACKVLLQMRHRRLVPSLHCAELNEFIDFQQSPFVVQRTEAEWLPKEVDGVRYPLRAGISSFGAGGSNAHVILESHGNLTPAGEESSPRERVFPLSARTDDQLRQMALRLRDALRRDLPSLDDIAYTLQIGRKSFDCRLVVIARTKVELVERLSGFLEGRVVAEVITGGVKNAEGITRMFSGTEKDEFIRLLRERRDPSGFARLWVDGLLTDWQSFGARGRRVSLPTYPFADKRHWVWDRSRSTSLPAPANLRVGLHPLLDSNESTFERQLFKKSFHSGDFFIHDHHVSDIPTLPGVAYLELARIAGEMAAGRKVRKIRNILWLSPIAVRDGVPLEAIIELKPAKEGAQFEVFSEDGAGHRTVHSQGKLVFAGTQETDPAPELIDIERVRARCARVIDGAQAYPLFKSFGLGLGPSFQVLKDVYKNEREILGVLSLGETRREDLRQMVLHPALIDGSLQAGVAAHLGAENNSMLVPFSIGEVEILQPLQPECFSYVTPGDEAQNPGSRVSRTHISILDARGQVLVRIRDSVGVPLREVHKSDSRADEFRRLYYRHQWVKSALSAQPAETSPVLLFAPDEFFRRLYLERSRKTAAGAVSVILVQPGEGFEDLGEDSYRVSPGNPEDFVQLLDTLGRKNHTVERVCFAWPLESAVRKRARHDVKSLQDSLQKGVYSLLFLYQALMKQGSQGNVQLLYVYCAESGQSPPQHEAVNGFARALHLESPRLRCKTLEVRQSKPAFDRVLDAAIAEFHPQAREALSVRYDEQERYTRRLDCIDLEPSAAGGAHLRDKGTYLITGGAGGLGLHLAEYLARQHQARLVLTGRSELSSQQESKLAELRGLGAEVLYLRADVSDREAVQSVLEQTRRHFGALHGIIHAAGVLRDSYARSKTSQQMEAVFAPKVYGTLHLDELSQADPLDFFVLFSSLAAVGGNAGQCDYAFANHFMDSFAARRERLRADGSRHGKTLSLNWSIWAHGGMRLDEQTSQFFKKTLGLMPLETEAGIDAFVKCLASDSTQLAVLEGVREKIEIAWGMRPAASVSNTSASVAPAAPAASPAGAVGDSELLRLVQGELSGIVVSFLKLDSTDVSLDSVLLDLGFDSMGLATFANSINEKYQLDITPVLFFDYPSIAQISQYLCLQRTNEVSRVHRDTTPLAVSPAAARAPGLDDAPLEIRKGAMAASEAVAEPVRVGATLSPQRRFVDQPIAIVGMSGVMPQSQDLEEFWEHLRHGRDLITEIPPDRWKWQDYFGDPLKEVNKSNSKWGGFMREVDKFDPLFFGISPREARMMDPQQRIFLETVWKAVEDSGQKVSDLAGTRTGLFVGVATNDYIDLMNGLGVGLDGYTASGNSHSVLANRVSFLLNLRGPSAPLDTACSSSLVAIHRAIESIHSGSCDMAIVGGVQVMLTPAAYISFGIAGMLSSDGKCKAFDKRANGYVRGEGSGAIFLKPLAQAETDGNHIYAVIKATAENHGGRVTTLTAPNSTAQCELLVEAYEKAQIDPTTVGYIECHGTGTGLGDPIEIQALTRSFTELYGRQGKAPPAAPHCGLSSVKTNIGHLETAAGIAGILKALLAIRHQQIPANVHFEELNPYINLKGSPFFIAAETTPWTAPQNAAGVPLPRRAGVSSFGFGGANAHVVLEEYIPKATPVAQVPSGPCLIVLSARNEERLKAYAQRMLTHLETHTTSLVDFAYTLQVGRDEMAERLALVVSDIEELKQRFGEFLRGDTEGPWYRGRAPNRKGDSARVDAGNLAELAKLWVTGVSVDWRLLHRSPLPKRLSLPTYPFARERYWIAAAESRPAADKPTAETTTAPTASLHPLIQRNISTLREQRFASRFSGEEFYLADHIVESQKILPGVAYLEMARVAGELSGQQPVRALRNVVWERPLIIGNEAKDVEVTLAVSKDEVVFSVRTAAQERATAHCSGKLVYGAPAGEPESVDLASIQRRCAREVLRGSELYPLLDGAGLKLGASFQIVEKICATASESLAWLKLPAHLAGSASQFGLHPALMDGSLHTAIGLMQCSGLASPLRIPYSLGEVQIFAPLTDLRYSYATWDPAQLGTGGDLPKVTFQLLDSNGRVLVRIKELVTRSLFQKATSAVSRAVSQTKPPAVGLSYYHTTWQRQPLPAPVDATVPAGRFLVFDNNGELSDALERALGANCVVVSVRKGPTFQQRSARLYEIDPFREADYEELLRALEQQGSLPETVVHGWAGADFGVDPDALQAMLGRGVYSLLYFSRGLGKLPGSARPARTRLVYIYPNRAQASQPQHAAIGAFGRSVMLEDSRLQYTCLSHEDSGPEEIAARVLDEVRTRSPGFAEVRHAQGARWVSQVSPLELAPVREAGLKERGVYLITGGLGGLGLIFARFLAREVRARLVLASRSAANEAQQRCIRELESLGAEVLHCQVDVASLADVERMLEGVRTRFGALDGVLHCAGVLRDALLQKKTRADLDAVFAAKIQGTLNLDAATRACGLDFFALFSSLTAVTGNAGQCDYAYANSFLDHFAQWRNDLLQKRQRSGKTFSVNWPLWKEGGMRVPEQVETFLEQSLGIHPLDTETGWAVFRDALGGEVQQLLAMQGVTEKIHRTLGLAKGESKSAPVATRGAAEDLSRLLRADLMRVVQEVLLISEREFAADVDMSEYGLDSISLAKFFSEVNGRYSLDLTPAVFFEYPTFNAFTGHLLAQYPTRLAAHFERDLQKVAPAALSESRRPPVEAALPPGARFLETLNRGVAPERNASATEFEVAVVGMSGVFPQSQDLETFWENLAAERDLITEIPADRWDWRAFEGNPFEERNKTNSRWGGFLKEVDKFDSAFFGITPFEAQLMDPQKRIFFETVWKAIEDSGHRPSELAGTRTGVFVGVAGFDYLELLRDHKIDVVAYTATGMSHCVLPNRISYMLDLHGPSEPVDTACSSSLIAIHRAARAIADGNCEMAIAGGVNLLLSPSLYLAFGNAGMLSSDGRCKTFDKRANGYVRGEGSGAVFLKRLDRALADGDHVYGVIKGSAVNHGGRATSLTAPNPNAQAELLVEAYEQAGIDPNTIGYIEAHGTGTALGDPVEINGLKKAFKELYRRRELSPRDGAFCGVGSVKTNIGHLEMAAGIAGFIKTLLAIRHRSMPGNVHYRELNPHIRLEDSPFFIVERTQPWAAPKDEYGAELPRTAGVSSFGFGGANAHVIVQEYLSQPVEADDPAHDDEPVAVLLSAKTVAQLEQQVRDLLHYMRKKTVTAAELRSIAYTLQVGREFLPERVGFLSRSATGLETQLESFLNSGDRADGIYRGNLKDREESVRLISQDADLKETILEKWLTRKKLSGLVELWVKGIDFDWSRIYGEVKPQRASLPTYPFARNRCWFEAAVVPVSAQSAPRKPDHQVERLKAALRAELRLLQEGIN